MSGDNDVVRLVDNDDRAGRGELRPLGPAAASRGRGQLDSLSTSLPIVTNKIKSS